MIQRSAITTIYPRDSVQIAVRIRNSGRYFITALGEFSLPSGSLARFQVIELFGSPKTSTVTLPQGSDFPPDSR